MNTITLKEADKVEITILVDNYSDFLLPDTPNAKRLRTPPPDSPLAEHGLSCLITAYAENQKHTVLMDVGISGTCLNHNAALLEKSGAAALGVVQHRIQDADTLVISHGHFDHFSGLASYLAANEGKLTLVAHPHAFGERRVKIGEDAYFTLPSLDTSILKNKGVTIECRSKASTLGNDLILLAGQVERVTDFEKGTPNMEALIDGNWVLDPFRDDQAVAVNIKEKGLVVIGGCSHAGIVNTVKHLCKTAQTERVHAVLGGFHLSGAGEGLIDPTVAAIKEMAPQFVVPMHCTGWNATVRFAEQLPDAFILNSVGTTYIFD